MHKLWWCWKGTASCIWTLSWQIGAERHILSAWILILWLTRAEKSYWHIMDLIYYILIIYMYLMLKVWWYMITSAIFTTSNKNIKTQHSIDEKSQNTPSNKRYWWYKQPQRILHQNYNAQTNDTINCNYYKFLSMNGCVVFVVTIYLLVFCICIFLVNLTKPAFNTHFTTYVTIRGLAVLSG